MATYFFLFSGLLNLSKEPGNSSTASTLMENWSTMSVLNFDEETATCGSSGFDTRFEFAELGYEKSLEKSMSNVTVN